MPPSLEVTVPPAKTTLTLLTVRVNRCTLNVAVTDRAPLIVTVQVVSETPSHPLQPPKVEPPPALAVSVTTLPLSYVNTHVGPQLMPPSLEVTVPLPVPTLLTVRVNRCTLNVAVTDRAPLIVTVQVVSETPSQPLQPPKVEPSLALGVSVTTLPLSYVNTHVGPQLMPPSLEVTVPLPVPPLLTVRVKRCSRMVVVIDDAPPLVSVPVVAAPPSPPPPPPTTKPSPCL